MGKPRLRKKKDRTGFCPKCGNFRRLTSHHVFPKRWFGQNNGVCLQICRECHDEIEEVLPYDRKLGKDEYIEITKRWLRGEKPLVLRERRKDVLDRQIRELRFASENNSQEVWNPT